MHLLINIKKISWCACSHISFNSQTTVTSFTAPRNWSEMMYVMYVMCRSSTCSKNIKLLFTNIVLRYTSCLLCNIQIPITYILLNNALNSFDNFLLSLLSLRPWPRLNTDPEHICEFLCIENIPQWSIYFYIIAS